MKKLTLSLLAAIQLMSLPLFAQDKPLECEDKIRELTDLGLDRRAVLQALKKSARKDNPLRFIALNRMGVRHPEEFVDGMSTQEAERMGVMTLVDLKTGQVKRFLTSSGTPENKVGLSGMTDEEKKGVTYIGEMSFGGRNDMQIETKANSSRLVRAFKEGTGSDSAMVSIKRQQIKNCQGLNSEGKHRSDLCLDSENFEALKKDLNQIDNKADKLSRDEARLMIYPYESPNSKSKKIESIYAEMRLPNDLAHVCDNLKQTPKLVEDSKFNQAKVVNDLHSFLKLTARARDIDPKSIRKPIGPGSAPTKEAKSKGGIGG